MCVRWCLKSVTVATVIQEEGTESFFVPEEIHHEKKRAHLRSTLSSPICLHSAVIVNLLQMGGLYQHSPADQQGWQEKIKEWHDSVPCWRALLLSCQSYRHDVGCKNLPLLTVVTSGIRSIFVCTQELAEQLPAGIYSRGDLLSVQDASEFNSAVQDTIYFFNT